MAEYTIDLCEGGTATASSKYSTSHWAEYAFDNLTEGPLFSRWIAAGTSITGEFITYEFLSAETIIKLRMAPEASARVVKEFAFEGSNNGTDYTLIGTKNPLQVLGWQDFIFTNETAYIYYRIRATDETHGNTYWSIVEIEMMGEVPVGTPYIRPDNITGLYNLSSIKGNLRGKASEGFIRPTLSQFFTSMDFEEIASIILTAAGYIFGGAYVGWIQDCDEYAPDTWTSKTNIPPPARGASGASAILDKGYIYGGSSPGNMADCDEYDPDTWTSKTDMSFGKSDIAACTILDKGYIYGGNAYLQDCDEYDPDTWTSKTDMPAPGRSVPTASTILDKGYIYGGASPTILQDCDEYDPDTWTNKTDMPSPSRNKFAASTILDKGYVYCGGGYVLDCDEYDPDTWTSKTDAPTPGRNGLAASTVSGKGCIFGGLDGANKLQDCDEYDPDTWTSKTDTPSPGRSMLAACSI